MKEEDTTTRPEKEQSESGEEKQLSVQLTEPREECISNKRENRHFPSVKPWRSQVRLILKKGVSLGFSNNEAIWDLDKSFSGETDSSQMGWGWVEK